MVQECTVYGAQNKEGELICSYTALSIFPRSLKFLVWLLGSILSLRNIGKRSVQNLCCLVLQLSSCKA